MFPTLCFRRPSSPITSLSRPEIAAGLPCLPTPQPTAKSKGGAQSQRRDEPILSDILRKIPISLQFLSQQAVKVTVFSPNFPQLDAGATQGCPDPAGCFSSQRTSLLSSCFSLAACASQSSQDGHCFFGNLQECCPQASLLTPSISSPLSLNLHSLDPKRLEQKARGLQQLKENVPGEQSCR